MQDNENIPDLGIPNSTSNMGASDKYTTLSQWHSKPSELRVICVGVGAAGLLMAYKMKKLFTNYEFVCYEKNHHIGGTWYEKRYPGCACNMCVQYVSA